MKPIVSSRLPAAAAQLVSDYVTQHIPTTFPACNLVVLHCGQPILEGAWGSCDGIVPDLNRRWDIASVTKLFTTTLVLQLVSNGHLSLDTPVAQLVKAFARVPIRPVDAGQNPHTLERTPIPAQRIGRQVDAREITLRHLLTHNSGLHDWLALFLELGPVPPPPMAGMPMEAAERRQKAIELISLAGFRDRAGQSIAYSDLGFILLGEIASQCTAEPLEEAMDTRVLQRLGLEHTCFNPVASRGLAQEQILPTELDLRWRQRRAWGEVHDENACAMGGVSGHAGLFSTANDVARLGQVWLIKDHDRLNIHAELIDSAISVQAEDAQQRRGLGFMLKAPTAASCGDFFSEQSFGHTGYTGTSLWVDPAAGLVVACLTNAVYGGRNMQMQSFRRGLHDRIQHTLNL